jgi:hypothetical protein
MPEETTGSRLAIEPNRGSKLRVNLCLEGDPAEWYYGWKTRGLVASVKDALLMSFQALQEKLTEQDLKRAQLKTLTNAN